MKKILPLALLCCCVILANSPIQAAEDPFSRTIAFYQKVPQTKPFFASAYGYAVFPMMGKGALFIGGAFGDGQVYRQGRLAGTVSQANISLGFQLGGQAYNEIIFFQDKRAYDEFTSGSFELESKASLVAITAGIQAQASTTGENASASAGPATTRQFVSKYSKGMAVFVHTHGGLMAEAAVGGQFFEFKPLQRQ